MKFSNKIIQRLSLLKFNKPSTLSYEISVELVHHNSSVKLYFSTVDLADEVCIEKLTYTTTLEGEYLAILDAFIELCQKRPVEAIDRFPVKELDYYLRDQNTQSAFSSYDQKLYEILSIGEEVKNIVFPKKRNLAPQLSRSFESLSYSEQLEYVEELFAYHFYSKEHKFSSFNIEEIDNLVFSFSGTLGVDTKELVIFLEKELSLVGVSLIIF